MILRESVATGFRELRAHKARSILSCLSITVGVAAMVYTFSQIEGMFTRRTKMMELMGPGRLEIEQEEGYKSRGLSRGLTVQDAERIRQMWPELYMVFPMARRWGAKLAFGDFRTDNILIEATTPEWRKRGWVFSLRGRFLNEHDLKTAARVCVVVEPGGWIKKSWWAKRDKDEPFEAFVKRHDLLGKQLRIEEHLFTVVGVLREPPKDKDPRWQRYGGGGTVMVPISTYRYFLATPPDWGGRADGVEEIAVDTGDASTAGVYMRRIEGLLKNLHRDEPDFKIRDYREIIQGWLNKMKKMAMAIMVIGIVAVLAGGIGIMNVTLATVFSRVREIGIRRALGATRGDILGQFIVEAVLLGLTGGLAGSALGAAAVTKLAPQADRMAEISSWHVGAALAIAATASFLFALWPAWQASRLDPIEALRYE
ncbi:MAG: ABC transporter permease [Elusimicrobia bacterium]|nr:ABC transporter permease [Elusimicrobiota bacterium]